MAKYCKYYQAEKMVTYNGGLTWHSLEPPQYGTGSLIERNSPDCGYVDMSTQYLTIEITQGSGTLEFSGTSSTTVDNSYIQYSRNSGQTWNTLYRGNTISVETGDIIMWKATNLVPYYDSENEHFGNCGVGTFKNSWLTGFKYKVYGNIMSLLYGDNFRNQKSLQGYVGMFGNLFAFSHVEDAKDLILPAEILTKACYSGMFQNCHYLEVAPTLSSTTMAERCYSGMFFACTRLTDIQPVLQATVLKENCYEFMYGSCYALTTTPKLYARTIDAWSCYAMFESCSGLTTIPEDMLPATDLTTTVAGHGQCYGSMFQACTSLVSVPKNLLPATKLSYSCYESMFRDCSNLKYIPDLPATSLSGGGACYARMFQGCTSLSSVPSNYLPATTLTGSCYAHMFYGCTSLTTAPDLLASSLVGYDYSYMFQGCSRLSYIKCTASSVSAYNCIKDWVDGVASSGTFVKKSTTTWPSGSSGIPNNWTIRNV